VDKITLKNIALFLAFGLVFLPMLTSSVADYKQKKKNQEIEEQKLLAEKKRQEAEEKIYLMGKFDPAQNKDFVLVPKEYNVGGYEMYLRKETLSAFLEMAKAAKEDSIDLKIASATRNFDYQKNLWNNKWSGYTLVEKKDLSKTIPDGLLRFKKILEYSSAPGTSRHHWGTDIDINDANPAYFLGTKGEKEYAWLVKNGARFGFCQTYNSKDIERPTGYNEEKWHWSYLPLSKDFTKNYLKLVKEEDINDFMGAEYVLEQDLINDYVLGINKDCI
jgi:LAS superfamily LD-carboxypeptidase LdcB